MAGSHADRTALVGAAGCGGRKPARTTLPDDGAYLTFRNDTEDEVRVFVYAGDLWSVPRSGGDAVRLTSGAGSESDPTFSPDGSTIAFTGEYDGNVDVYTVPAGGGVPKRLTWHPSPDQVLGWSPDGKRIVFTSPRTAYSPCSMTVPVRP